MGGGYFGALAASAVKGDDGVGVGSCGLDDVGGFECGWGHGCGGQMVLGGYAD